MNNLIPILERKISTFEHVKVSYDDRSYIDGLGTTNEYRMITSETTVNIKDELIIILGTINGKHNLSIDIESIDSPLYRVALAIAAHYGIIFTDEDKKDGDIYIEHREL